MDAGWPHAPVARTRLGGLVDGVSVVTVNFNGLENVRALVAAVRRYSPADTRIIVIDNHSTDGSVEWLRGRDDVQLVALPVNILHARAMDLGFWLTRTEYAIALDVDAFPVSSEWIERSVGQLDADVHVVGARYTDRFLDYAHPCFLAMRVRRFVTRRHTFREMRLGGDMVIDTGASITMREAYSVAFIEATSVRGPGDIGTVYGDAVYHNFYGTRLKNVGSPALRELGQQSRAAWDEAVVRYLGSLNGS